MAILIKKNFEYQILDSYYDNSKNIISVDLKLENATLKVINIYGPNIDSPWFYENLNDLVKNNHLDYTIVCGDFNLVLNPNMDSHNYKAINNPRALARLLDMISEQNLKDTFRLLQPSTRRYTWRRKIPIKQARLDYFLCSDNLCDHIKSSVIKPGYRSDHSIIELKIILCNFKRGRGTWKLNCSLLENKEYLIMVNNLIDSEKLNYAARVYNPNFVNRISDRDLHMSIPDDLFLEVLLLKIRGETIKFASRLKKKEQNFKISLEKKIEELEAVCNEENLNELINKKESLVKLCAKELEASKIRSRVTWLKDGEKPSKFLTSLENKGYIDKTIKRLQKQDGQLISNQKDILKEVKNFYKRLFSQTKNDCEPQLNVILKKLNTVKLTEDETGSLENELSIEEIGEALKLMKNGKSPGIDGFPAEFFKIFWKKIKFFVLKAYKYAYNKGEMSTSLRHCLITCIPKGNKHRIHLKNLRPISLLSCVYKIISSAVANRLKKILDKLISKTQTGFVSGRYIGENIWLIYDLLHYTEKENIPGLIMLVDFEKAFDSVSWSFIYRVLDFLNFGNNFKNGLNCLTLTS